MLVRSEVVQGMAHPALRPYVKRFTGFRELSDRPIRRRELPISGVAVILALESAWDIGTLEGGALESYRSFAGGIIDSGPAVSEHQGFAHTLQFDLTPLGALTLLGVPGSAIAGQVVSLDGLIGSAADRLVDELVHTEGWDARFALLNSWLRARLDAAAPVSPDVAWAWRRLVESSGAVPIGDLLREIGCSSRHLSRRFGHDVGLTPKTFGRLVRFERATDRLRTGDAELGVIAADAGYADQAHFTRDVKAFAGVTPGALMAERAPSGFLL